MHNDILTFGSYTIHGYGLMIAIGLLAGLLVARVRVKSKGLIMDQVFNITIVCMIFGFLGAKLMYLIVENKSLLFNPIEIITESGFVVYGGIILGIVSAIVYCKIKKLPFLKYFDLMIPSVAVVQAFGRDGCFLAGCCYGKATNAFYGITFHDSYIAPNGIKLIPTQLISSIGLFIIAGILILYARKERQPGRIGALYLLMYSGGRFLVEFLRDDLRGSIGGLSTSQFIAIWMFAAGVILLVAQSIFAKRKAVVPTE